MVCICIICNASVILLNFFPFFTFQLWIDNSVSTPTPAPEKKETDFFDEHTQVS